MAEQKEHSKTLPGSQISISEPKEPQMGQSRGKLRGQEIQGMCGCCCSVSLLGAGRSISDSLQYGARGQVGLHATISSPNTLFLKNCSPKLVHLSSQTYSSFCPSASSCLITCFWLQENPPAPHPVPAQLLELFSPDTAACPE